jgi:type IV pilus assembly protein PilB
MTDTIKNKIINSLIDSLGVQKKDIEAAQELQKQKAVSFARALMDLGVIKEEDFLALLVKELRIPFIKLKKYKLDPALKVAIPERYARKYHIVPLSQMENKITVAIADPLNVFAIDDLKNITGCDIDVVMSLDSDIAESIDKYYGTPYSTSVQDVTKDIDLDGFEIITDQESAPDSEISSDEGEQAPVIRIVNLIIREALKQRTSDIHIEPMQDHVRVRYRIDGVLRDAMKVPKESQNAILIRLKIMSRTDITETRTPQDGRFKMLVNNHEVDFRVSLLPTTFGQKVVLRVLDKKTLQVGLEGLGFSPKSLGVLKRTIMQPFGMVLVTGPTGSGKSTTLYSIINELNTVERNIITVEDPVEYLIDGLTQIQVHAEIGLTFAAGLKAILRQSPDIVMVGEIRDSETADIAIKAALTGQLVFSTLHTNDSAGAMTRLVDMGVEPFLVASSVMLVCAQRLCRKICSHCRRPADIPAAALERLNFPFAKGATFYEGKGCDYCRQTGYRGRIGITEILEVDDIIREMLIRGESSDKIKHYAHERKGMVLLWDDIMQRFIDGDTTLEEVLRITTRDE